MPSNILLSENHLNGPRNVYAAFNCHCSLPVLSDDTVISSQIVWWKWTDEILNAKYFAWKNYTSGKWGLREAFNQNSLMQLFNGDRRIVQCIKYSHEKVIFIKHSLSQAQIYEHKEPTFLTMRSPWFDYQQRICHALCLWVGFLKPKTLCKNIVLFA